MAEVLRQVLRWCAAYLLVGLLPLGVALLGETPAGRGFWIEFGVALGIVGFAMLALQFVTTTRFRPIAPYFGTDAKIQFHRETGILAVLFVLAHPVVLFLADPRYLDFLNPWSNLPRAMALSAATGALILLIALPLWRVQMRLSYEWWRITHGALAFVVVFVGVVHSLQIGHYVSGLGKQALWALGGGAAIALLLHTRVMKPLRMKRQPYRVSEVKANARGVYNLVLEPDAHPGMNFRSGQYAWLTVGPTPLTLQQHPFSFASSDTVRGTIEFGIKELGDFTATVKGLCPGTPAFLEGPYGSFVLDPRARGAVFIAGGIGITPALSILRSCRDRRDERPFLLIYANRSWDDIAFRDELDALRQGLTLEIVHVLAEPPKDWAGESGLITADLLARHLSRRKEMDLQYFICGPAAMMDVVEPALAALGVPLWRLGSERFDLV